MSYYWQQTTRAFDERLVELAHLLFACRDAFFETVQRFHWVPAPESLADKASLELVSPQGGSDASILEPDTEHRLVAEVIASYLHISAGHLSALGALYSAHEVLFSPGLLVRAVLENSAHTMWVIGNDRFEPAENRLARAYLEERLSALQAKMNAARLDPDSSAAIKSNAEYVALRSQILRRFPTTTRAHLADSTLHGQKLPRPEHAVEWMFAFLERSANGSISGDVSSGMYGYLSNLTHPTLYPIRQMREWSSDDPTHPHERVANLSIDAVHLERLAIAAITAFYSAHSSVTSYFGWDTQVHDRLTAEIGQVAPRTFC